MSGFMMTIKGLPSTYNKDLQVGLENENLAVLKHV